MRIVIRADASTMIGSGHIMRCLTLANELRQLGAQVTFICRILPGDLSDLVEKQGFPVIRLEGSQQNTVSDVGECLSKLRPELDNRKVEWLVVDHYGLDAAWEIPMRSIANGILVIDDMANRVHDCDVLLDQNYYPNASNRYNGLIPPASQRLLGPTHALLRPEFREARRHLELREGPVSRILLFFGGSDHTDETSKALRALNELHISSKGLLEQVAIDVIIGAGNPRKEKLLHLVEHAPHTRLHTQVTNMAEFMGKADLMIGAGGSTAWERLFLGMPSLTVVVAENQAEGTAALAELGLTLNLGWHEDVSEQRLSEQIAFMLTQPQERMAMQEKAIAFMGHIGQSNLSSAAKLIMGGFTNNGG